ncbi:putative membrane protein [Fontibacillus phaseoli]|uniref:Putative membrane protein n=1 Tax=Fontibacillus phaseoli TaxID=1416533 RepID=A0A369B6B0_9BACL|nr:YhgE/Pip domain-containing protein [Fontibacillus phaseoli]RCX17062.1 putative membrane protein [Fontibacillus phaseoli]
MKSIFSIYAKDLRGIVTNWATAVIIGGLIILPSLYAWFNIKASWDPYGQTSGIQVAVVNEDTGTTMRGQPLRIGDEIIGSLNQNHNIGWNFLGEKKAMTGLKRGQYYAVIIIPCNFSARIASVLTPNPEKAEILYYVNEKINAVAPKITAKGASSVISEVNRNFIKTANGTIFSIFNQIGLELKQELPLIRKIKTLAFRIQELYPEINQAAGTAVQDLHTSREILGNVQAELPHAADLAATGQAWSGKTSQFLDESGKVLEAASPAVEETLSTMANTAEAVAQSTGLLLAALDQDEDVTPFPSKLSDKLAPIITTVADSTDSLSAMLLRLEAAAPGDKLAGVITSLHLAGEEFRQMAQLVQDFNNQAKETKANAKTSLKNLNDLAASSALRLDRLAGSYDTEIYPAIQSVVAKLKQEAEHAGDMLKKAESDLPVIDKVLTDAAKGLTVAVSGAEDIVKDLPAAEIKLSEVTNRITSLEKEGSLEDLIGLLSLNFSAESEFFAEPVILKENRVFPLPNYGSAMSPFFTTLSVWVGGLLLVSMLTVEVHDTYSGIRSYQEYIGRFLTFLTLALLQSVFTTTGDLLLLGTYAADPMRFVIYGLLLAGVFMLIIYTLVSVFGNVGKAMAIVLLVLQLAGSGGTFPIQVTPPFFQAIYPFLPFTYGISLMREAVGGSVRDIVTRDIIALLIFAGLALALGLGLKKVVNKAAAKWVKKAKSGHLIH